MIMPPIYTWNYTWNSDCGMVREEAKPLGTEHSFSYRLSKYIYAQSFLKVREIINVIFSKPKP